MSSKTNTETGLWLNNGSGRVSNPTQNKHMHLYEAFLQAYRAMNYAVWLDRAASLRTTGLLHFMDVSFGSIAEFLTPDL